MKDRAVLDASGAMHMLLHQEIATEVNTAFSVILSLPLFKFEMGNICWKYVQFSDWDSGKAEEFLTRAIGLTTEFENIPKTLILQNAIKNHLSYYDSSYLTLALITQSTLISKDKKLNSVANKFGIQLFF